MEPLTPGLVTMYASGLPAEARLRAVLVIDRLPFVFEASGAETHFTNGYAPCARRLFNFPYRRRSR